MPRELLILIGEAITVYFLVLWAHSLRNRVGLAPFYALLGGLTAVMSWITDAGVKVEIPPITLMVGSTVFYTSLLLGVFVVYVFDGVRATRVAIFTVTGVSIMVPIIAIVLQTQMRIADSGHVPYIPVPSLRINAASVLTTICDLLFLAIAWEFFGKARLHLTLWLRSFITLLGVMWLDVLLFSTGAFAGTPGYRDILGGTLLSRLLICLFAYPFLLLYLKWQNRRYGMEIEHRPILAILKEVTDVRLELSLAQQEIERRKQVEQEREKLIAALQDALSEVRTLRGFLPTCSHCKKIKDPRGEWRQLEEYIQENSDATFSHGVCPDCVNIHYAGFRKQGGRASGQSPEPA